jgi:hypothetical protein
MKAKRPEWVWERFRTLYLGGVSYPLMAEHTGVPAGTLRVWRIKMGLPSRKSCRAKVRKPSPLAEGAPCSKAGKITEL